MEQDSPDKIVKRQISHPFKWNDIDTFILEFFTRKLIPLFGKSPKSREYAYELYLITKLLK